MKIFYIFLFLFFSFENSYCSNCQRRLEDFKGDELVIGLGNVSYFRGQRVIDRDKEYSIDYLKGVTPCLLANGLDIFTYVSMPEKRFSKITFQHIGFSPVPFCKFYDHYGHWIASEFSKELWNESNMSYSLPLSIWNLLKPGGLITYKTAVMKDEVFFADALILPDQNALSVGLQCWKDVYERASFEKIMFKKIYHESLMGWYIQMTAIRPEI